MYPRIVVWCALAIGFTFGYWLAMPDSAPDVRSNGVLSRRVTDPAHKTDLKGAHTIAAPNNGSPFDPSPGLRPTTAWQPVTSTSETMLTSNKDWKPKDVPPISSFPEDAMAFDAETEEAMRIWDEAAKKDWEESSYNDAAFGEFQSDFQADNP